VPVGGAPIFNPGMMPVMAGQPSAPFVAGPGQGQFVTMPPQFAPQQFAPQQFAPQQFAQQQAPQRQPAPTRPPPPVAQGGAPRPAMALGKVDDEAPRPLALPSPEQIGVALPSPERVGVAAPPSGTTGTSGLDWTAARRRMQQAGVLSFQLEQLSGGGYRFVCVLAGVQPGRTQRIEAEGANEAEAVRNVLQRLGGGN
jgi:hypothetical protein